MHALAEDDARPKHCNQTGVAEPTDGDMPYEAGPSMPDEKVVAMRTGSARLTSMMFAATMLVLAAIAGFWAIGTNPSPSGDEIAKNIRGTGAPSEPAKGATREVASVQSLERK